MRKQCILVEYKDGSFQWLEGFEKDLLVDQRIKRICGELYGRSKACTSKKWKIGKSQFEKIIVN